MLCVTNLPPCLFDHTPPGVFDGQGSGHDFYGTMWNPPSGFVSGMDGDRAGHFNCDYRQVPKPHLLSAGGCVWREPRRVLMKERILKVFSFKKNEKALMILTAENALQNSACGRSGRACICVCANRGLGAIFASEV